MSFTRILKYLYRRPQHLLIRLLASGAKTLDVEHMNTVVVISPHPDDEVFGCAMLMNTLAKQGKDVHLIILSKGEYISAGSCIQADAVVKVRAALTKQAARVLGIDEQRIYTLSFPDGSFTHTPDVEISSLKKLLDSIKPNTIFYPHPSEGSPDHDAASRIISCIEFDKRIHRYYYCVWLWHHMPLYKAFSLNYSKAFVLKGDYLKKLEAIAIYVNANDGHSFYYSGNLPKMFVKAVSWDKELFFKV